MPLDDLPPPLVPADCDVSGSPFMLIVRARELNSPAMTRGSAEGYRDHMILRLRSVDQFPSGSLPDDDIDLARLADYGRDVEAWRSVKSDALHGWIKCSDGRLYHPDVAEGVNNIWNARATAAEKGRKGARKRWGSNANSQRVTELKPGHSPAMPKPMPADSNGDGDGDGDGSKFNGRPASTKAVANRQRSEVVDLPDWLPRAEWNAFLEMRRKKKAPLEGRAQTLLIAKLSQLRNEGHDPAAVLDQSTLNSWKSVFEIKPTNRGTTEGGLSAARGIALALGDSR